MNGDNKLMGYEEYLDKVKQMIDDLKAMTADLGSFIILNIGKI